MHEIPLDVGDRIPPDGDLIGAVGLELHVARRAERRQVRWRADDVDLAEWEHTGPGALDAHVLACDLGNRDLHDGFVGGCGHRCRPGCRQTGLGQTHRPEGCVSDEDVEVGDGNGPEETVEHIDAFDKEPGAEVDLPPWLRFRLRHADGAAGRPVILVPVDGVGCFEAGFVHARLACEPTVGHIGPRGVDTIAMIADAVAIGVGAFEHIDLGQLQMVGAGKLQSHVAAAHVWDRDLGKFTRRGNGAGVTRARSGRVEVDVAEWRVADEELDAIKSIGTVIGAVEEVDARESPGRAQVKLPPRLTLAFGDADRVGGMPTEGLAVERGPRTVNGLVVLVGTRLARRAVRADRGA